jgi:hypothetical protein
VFHWFRINLLYPPSWRQLPSGLVEEGVQTLHRKTGSTSGNAGLLSLRGQEQHVDVCASLSDELEAREYVDVTDIFSRTSTTSPLCVGSPPTAGRLPSDALESRIRALVAESVQQHLQQQQQSKQQQELDAASFGCAASERSLRTRHSAQESLRTRPTPHKNGLIVTGLF